MQIAKYLIPSLLCIWAGCGDNSHKKEINQPVADSNTQPTPSPIPTPTPSPTVTPIPTSDPTPVPGPTNPGYVKTDIFDGSKITILVKGLPDSPIFFLDDVNETVKIQPEFEIRGEDGSILPASEFDTYMTISKRLSDETVIEFTDRRAQIEEIDFFVQDKTNRKSFAHVEFKILKAPTSLKTMVWNYYQHIVTHNYGIDEAKLLLLKTHSKGKEWLDVYLDAFDYYYGISTSGISARAFASNVGTKKEAAAWLSFYKLAFEYHYGISTSHQAADSFAEKAADSGKTQQWLDLYKEAYEFQYKLNPSSSNAHAFAAKAADKTQEWLKVYVNAFNFYYNAVISELQSAKFAENVADKKDGAAWLEVYKKVYKEQTTKGRNHTDANKNAIAEANRQYPN